MNDPVHVAGQGLLPEPVHDTLPGSAIGAGGLPDRVEYSAYESGNRRFAWLHDPATIEGEGAQFLFIDLRRSGDAWQVTDSSAYDSPEDALQAAGRAWLIANGGPDVPMEPISDFS